MQYLLSIPFIQSVANTSKNVVAEMVAYIKATLANETVQKIVLFSTILGLLLVAANLESIM